MSNPFSLTFGKTPNCFVDRPVQIQEIIETFESDTPVSQVYIITGVRGSGKTVTMTHVAKELESKNEWIVLSLNPNRDLLQSLSAALTEANGMKSNVREFGAEASILGVVGFTASMDRENDVEIKIDKLFQNIYGRICI